MEARLQYVHGPVRFSTVCVTAGTLIQTVYVQENCRVAVKKRGHCHSSDHTKITPIIQAYSKAVVCGKISQQLVKFFSQFDL